MIINAVLKCKKDSVPYRVYVNNDLITERLYTSNDKVISNNLQVRVVDCDTYDIRVENLSNTQVELIDYTLTKDDEYENT